ncbi:MAG TPA: hypothetical protein VGI73_04225 [Solirubrobacterales bacterium]|jgi:hypothetical protein
MSGTERKAGPTGAAAEVAPGLPSALAGIRGELEKLRAGIAAIEGRLAAVEQEEAQAPAKERPRRYYEVLVAVYERGGRKGLDADAFGAVGKEHGYDRRGLGGFFTGSRAPLRRQDGRVTLSVQGERLVDSYLVTLGGEGE